MRPMQAAFRLYQNTPPERIHTHQKVFYERAHGKALGPVPEEIIEEVRALLLTGLKNHEIRAQLQMGDRLYYKILRRIQARVTADERRKLISDLTERGLSERRIATIVGISRTAVQNHKRKLP